MAITTSGIYGPTLVRAWEDTLAYSLETNGVSKALLVTDTYTPNFGTHTSRSSLSAEVTGTGYTAGGKDVDGEVLALSGSSYVYFDHDDLSWTTATITGAMAMIGYIDTGVSANDLLIYCLDFVTAADVAGGTLLVTIPATGVFRQYLTP